MNMFTTRAVASKQVPHMGIWARLQATLRTFMGLAIKSELASAEISSPKLV